jgi:hypothetical protein
MSVKNITLNVRNTTNQQQTFDFMNGQGFGISPIVNNGTQYVFSSIDTVFTDYPTVAQVNAVQNGSPYFIQFATGTVTTLQELVDYLNINFQIAYWGITSGGALFAQSQDAITEVQLYYIP